MPSDTSNEVFDGFLDPLGSDASINGTATAEGVGEEFVVDSDSGAGDPADADAQAAAAAAAQDQAAADAAVADGDYATASEDRAQAETEAAQAGDTDMLHGSDSTQLDAAGDEQQTAA